MAEPPRILFVCARPAQRAIHPSADGSDSEVAFAESGEAAVDAVTTDPPAHVVVGGTPPDMTRGDLLAQLEAVDGEFGITELAKGSDDGEDDGASDGNCGDRRSGDSATPTETRRLQQEREFHERLLETSPVGIGVIDDAGNIVRINDRASEIFGVSKERLTERTYDDPEWDVYDEAGEEIPGEEFPVARAFETGEPLYDWEAELDRPDRSSVWASFNCAPLFDAEGNVERVVVVIEDVTARKQREDELQQQSAVIEGIFNAVPDPMYTFAASGEMLRWNEGFEAATGYTPEEIAERTALSFVPDEDEGKVARAISSVIEDGENQTVESAFVTKDGEQIPHEFSGGPVFDEDGDVIALTGVGRDITERIGRERQIADQRDELEDLNRINAVIRDIDQALVAATSREAAEQAVCDRLAAADAYQFATVGSFDRAFTSVLTRAWAGISADALEELVAVEDMADHPGAEAVKTGSVQVVHDVDAHPGFVSRADQTLERGFQSVACIPVTYEETTYGVLSVHADRESAFDGRERAVLAELGETLGHAIATIQQRKREEILTALQRATRELIHAESKAAVAERVIAAASEVLDEIGVGIFLFDHDDRTLTPSATTERLRTLYGDWPPTLRGEDALVWSTFLSGETVVSGDIGAETDGFDGSDARSGLFAPLGDHGVFVALSQERDAFDEDIERVLDLFAATAEATCDRVEGDRELRERDRELKRQNRQLTHLKGINDIIRELDQSIIHASSRQEIEREVCDRLTQYEPFAFVWVSAPDRTGDRVERSAWAGDGQGYLDAVSLDLTTGNTLPAVETIRSGAVTYVEDPAADLRADVWRQEALKRSYQSVVSVPLRYADVSYGALTVYATDATALDEMSRAVIEELGETIGHAINAIRTRRGILSGQAVELELDVRDEGVFHHLAATLGTEIVVTELLPQTDRQSTAFFEVENVPAATVQEATDALVNIREVTSLTTGGDRTRFRAKIDGQTVLHTSIQYGARPQRISVDADRTRLVVELPSESQVRPFVEKLERAHESVELVARTDRTDSAQSRDAFTDEFEQALTDRQLEVLRTAYRSGFFESPKEQTGTEIAAALDITQPTFNHHLRVAQRKLLQTLLGER